MGQETEGSLQQWREDYDTKSKEVNLSESFFSILDSGPCELVYFTVKQ
jgi:hypothetical protein